MAGNLLAVKQDDRDIVAILFEWLWILRNVDNLQRKIDLLPTTLDDVLGEVAQMAIGFGIDGDGREV